MDYEHVTEASNPGKATTTSAEPWFCTRSRPHKGFNIGGYHLALEAITCLV